MEVKKLLEGFIFKNTTLQIGFYLSVIVILSNLNAVTDYFLHPEIPYFDEEHLIVGGVTLLVSSILFGMIVMYARHLEQALGKIRMLESILPICSYCKKIRIVGSNGENNESWQSIECYITEHTNAVFSHSICPDCMKKYYPNL